MTGSPEALYCRGEGLGRCDFVKKRYTSERSARPGCNDGAIAANGLLYVRPWLCDCNLSILGQMVLGPAGRFDAQSQVVSSDNLQSAAELAADKMLMSDERDWPVNSGLLVHQAVAYAAAGIMFRDGTHVVALDARSGRLRWHNGTVGKPMNDQFALHAGSALCTPWMLSILRTTFSAEIDNGRAG